MNVLVSRGGKITKTVGDTINLGATTGTLKLQSYRGTILDWERQIDNQAWESIGNTATTYTETPQTEAMYSYRARVQISTCPEDYSTEVSIYVKDNSSLQDVANDFTFEVSPNPASSYISITTPFANSHTVRIVNTLGQVVYQAENCKSENMRIDLGGLDNGTYFLTVISEDKQSTKQIIVNK